MKYMIVATRTSDGMRKEYPFDTREFTLKAFDNTRDQAVNGPGASNLLNGPLMEEMGGRFSFKVTWSDKTYPTPWGGHEWLYTMRSLGSIQTLSNARTST